MYQYLTRHMVARKRMSYAGHELQPGERFVATPVDGDYFVQNGAAEDVPPQTVGARSPVAPPAVAPAAAAPAVSPAPEASEAPAPEVAPQPPEQVPEPAAVPAPTRRSYTRRGTT